MTTPEPMRYKDTLPVDVDEAAAAVYVRVSDAPVARTSERIPNMVMIDYDDGGYPVGIEVHLAQSATIPAQPPVTGATQDPRVAELLDILEGFCDEDRIRWVIIERLDRADAAAGIRRVGPAPTDEAADDWWHADAAPPDATDGAS